MTDEQKNCPYCHAPMKYLIFDDEKGLYVEFAKRHGVLALVVSDDFGASSSSANFCIKCGRDLRGGEE